MKFAIFTQLMRGKTPVISPLWVYYGMFIAPIYKLPASVTDRINSKGRKLEI
ncbi:hypothetical protein ABIB40_000446 [Pedobacter sp. UYP30]